MGTMNNKPGCCCCDCDCLVTEDDFSTNTISDYTQVSGTWSVSSGKLKCGDNNAVLLLKQDAGSEHCFALFVQKGTLWKILFAYKDSSNHLYAKFDVNAFGVSTTELHEVVDGVDSTLDTNTQIPGSGYFAVCYRNGEAALSSSLEDPEDWPTGTSSYSAVAFSAVSDPSALGTKVGVEIITTTVDVEFDEFELRNFCGTECPNCLAKGCLAGTEITSVTLTISGVTDDLCDACSDWNATYVLDSHRGKPSWFVILDDTDALPDCYDGDVFIGFWSYMYISLTIICDQSNNVIARIGVYRVQAGGAAVQREAVAEITLATEPTCCKVDCLTELDGKTFSFSDQNSPADLCEWDSAAAVIDSVSR